LLGDAMDGAAVRAAARGAELIVHAVNPPGYRDWERLVLPMIDHSIAAASAAGARILLPGTVYNFGPEAALGVGETTPQQPHTRKGRIRVEMERRLTAAAVHGVPSLVLRCGDFFGPGAASSWFAQVMVKPGRPLRRLVYPGRAGVGHQWAYLPDVAETMLRLLDRANGLPPFATFHMRGHWDADGRQMTAAIARAAGRPQLVPRSFPWWMVRLGAPVVPLFRELDEMRYLWRQPLCMDNARLCRVLGAEPHTPLDEAVHATLASLGCLAEELDGLIYSRI
ncbi:MAG: hypothetical protein WA924_06420, partial [Burkholderiaceae bacterium]